MKKIVLLVVMSLFLSACVTTKQAAKYTQGQEFENYITVGGSEVQVPLPEGRWTLVGQELTKNSAGTRFQSQILIQSQENALSKFVAITASLDHSKWGYMYSDFCNDNEMLYREKNANYDGSDQDCIALVHWTVVPGDSDDKSWIDTYDFLDTNNISVPVNALVSSYRKVSKTHYLSISYGVNPELDGFEAPVSAEWEMSKWHKSRYRRDPEKLKYVRELVDWTKNWDAKVNAGIKRQLAANN
ncbi:hypothetical protein [Kiloniella laminariae]|uniref:hypothetical protein n=1 Tax=Kiloniella laminariae TaxID=454162 RepID=UPI0003670D53|nr:hypothetical protein [Kiloniella laminariae]